MNTPIVTRFAPSPTGYMHIGNLRTALYAFLLAKHDNGKFLLRIEDTDRERLVEGATDVILSTLELTHLTYDEGPSKDGGHGPYIQSERRDIYKKYAEQLIKHGDAYYCFCSKERLSALHEADETGGYDRHCRSLSPDEIAKNLADGVPFVIRQKMPLEGRTTYTDAVFGEIGCDNSEMQDQVLLKADGYPTYNFAHVVDDYLMGVTHVVRGSEYLTSTPKYVLLYDAFGWERPNYVHLPLMMGKNEDGSIAKLSKRHGAVSFQDLVHDGYLPEAIINYIALLGWCPKASENEFFTLEELAELFTIDGISKSPAVFDFEKMLWFNGEYIRGLSFDSFKTMVTPFLPETPATFHFDKALSLVQSRLTKLSEIAEKMAFFYTLPDYDTALFLNKKNKVTLELAQKVLFSTLPVLEKLDTWDNDTLYASLFALATELEVKSGSVLWAVRIAVSGQSVTPGGATEIMDILGKEETLSRLKTALGML